jgi:enamine deaminase RidA (YjgF/YER057c/UK114 family)
MKTSTRRTFFSRLAAIATVIASEPKLLAGQATAPQSAAQTATQQSSTPGANQGSAAGSGASEKARHSNHIHNGIFYISGTGANDGYGKDDHILVTDPFEKHVTRTMDALKKSVERAGSTMDDIIHLQVFLCLPLSDSTPAPTGTARFEAHKAQYEALNKIYGTYFSPGKAPSRACMAVEWIPGDSLIEIVGSATVLNPASSVAGA